MTVDGHFHVWDPTKRDHAWLTAVPELDRRFSIEEFCELAETNGVGRAVLVQVLNDLEETYEFLALAADRPIVAGVVGWVDLAAPDVAEVLDRLRHAPGGERLVGIRHLVQGEPDPSYLERQAVLEGLRAVAEAGLVFDLLVLPAQLEAAVRAVRATDGLVAVLDHGGKPTIAAGVGEPWASLVADLAGTGRVACKISGLVTEAGPGWTQEAIGPFVDHLLESFGPERLVFGSDWPVCTVVADYGEVVELAGALLAQLTPSERLEVLGGNAQRLYGLESGATEP
jgi:L-fuconolactonase